MNKERQISKKWIPVFFKLVYFTLVIIIGHFIVKDMECFPGELFGNGDIMGIFKGFPQQIFYHKPELFDLYYLMTLAFTITDLIWLLFIYDKQSDFSLMLLHHICTVTLVVFSYLVNSSQIGIIVFYFHDLTDIFVYLTRIAILTKIPDGMKFGTAGILLAFFIYYRIYFFSRLLYNIFLHMNDWHVFNILLFTFLTFLLIMHTYWVYSIVKRFYHAKIEDVGKVKNNKSK